MFIENTKYEIKGIRPDDIFFLQVGSNTIMTSFKGQLRSAMGYLVAFKKGHVFNIFAYLYYRDMAEGQIFAPEIPFTSQMAMQRYQYAGIDFLEAMGFIMEAVNLKNMSPEERSKFIMALPFMHHHNLREYGEVSEEGKQNGYLLSGPRHVDYSNRALNMEEEGGAEIDAAPQGEKPLESDHHPLGFEMDKPSYAMADPSIKDKEKQKRESSPVIPPQFNLSQEEKDEVISNLGKLLASF